MHGQEVVASKKKKPDVSFKTVSAPNKPSSSCIDFLTEDDLARRWVCSASRLQRWRSEGNGPAYLKLGRKILYWLQDIQALEQSCQGARSASIASKAGGIMQAYACLCMKLTLANVRVKSPQDKLLIYMMLTKSIL